MRPDQRREWTTRRLAAARRAVAREQDAVALFPELSRYATVADRVAEIDETSFYMVLRWRAFQAKAWRKARRALAAMPDAQRRGMIRYWNQSTCPADPSYLLDALHRQRVTGHSPWSWLRFLRQLALVSAGKLPRAKLNETFER